MNKQWIYPSKSFKSHYANNNINLFTITEYSVTDMLKLLPTRIIHFFIHVLNYELSSIPYVKKRMQIV